MGLKKQGIVWLLFLSLLLSGLLVGCSRNIASGDVAGKLEIAIKYLSENKYEEAILAYQEVIKIDSKNVAAYKGLSLIYELQDKKDEAEKVLQDGLKAAGLVLELQMALAGFYVGTGRTDQAEAIYKELIKGDNSLVAYRAYSKMLVAGGKTSDALALLEQAVRTNTDYRLGSLLAELYVKSGDKDKALAMLKKSLEGQTEQSTAYTLLSRIYTGKLSDMLALGERMVQQGDITTGELIKLSALYGLGRYEDLVGEYQKSGDEIKNNNRARLLLAQAYSKLGNKDAALGIINAVDPGTLKDAGFLAEIAGYYLDAGDKETARKLALHGITLDNTAIENYVVMYKSYAGDDARIWAIKYIIMSELSYKEANLLVQNLMLTTSSNPDMQKNTLVKESPIPVQNGAFASLNPMSTKLQFYGGTVARKSSEISEREYKTRFDKSEPANIYFQIFSYITPPGRKVLYEIKSILYKSDGSILDTGTIYCNVEPTWPRSSITLNDYNGQKNSYWEVGSYKIEAFIEGNLVATGTFEVY